MLDLLLGHRDPLRVLALGAHCDDIEIGAGGTLLALADRQPAVHFGAFVATSTPERAAESRAALAALVTPGQVDVTIADLRDTRLPVDFDALKDHLGALAAEPWDLVLTPHADDAHQDHALIGRLAPTAFRNHLILRYEIPKWDGDLGSLRPNLYVPLSTERMHRKWEVLDEHYTSQHSRDWWDYETISALARLRGVECRSTYAEAFRADKMTLGLTPGR
ncbi:MAG: PIG-L family deacetylase [Ornithinimicrobium sp.]